MIIEQAFFSLPEIFFGSGYKYQDDNLLEAGIVSAFSLSLLQELNGRNIQSPINAIKSESSYISNKDENKRVDLFVDLKNVDHTQNGYGFKSTNYIEAKYFKHIIGNDTNHVADIIIDLYRLMLLTPKDKDIGRYFLHTYAGDPKFFIAQKYHWLLSLIKPGKHNITISLSYDDLAKHCPKIDINITVTNYVIANDKHSENFYFTLSKIEDFHIITTGVENNTLVYRFFNDRILELQNLKMAEEDFNKCFDSANKILREYLNGKDYKSHIEKIRDRVVKMMDNTLTTILNNDITIQNEFYKIKNKLEHSLSNKKQKDPHKYEEYSNDILNILDNNKINRIINNFINNFIRSHQSSDISDLLEKIGYEGILEILFQNLFDKLLLNLDSQYPKINELIQSKNGGKKLFCTNLLKSIRNKMYADFFENFSKYLKDKIISDKEIISNVKKILNDHKDSIRSKTHQRKLKKYYLIKNEELAKYIEELYCVCINNYLNHEFKFLYLINFNQINPFDFSFFEEIVYEEINNIAKNIPIN